MALKSTVDCSDQSYSYDGNNFIFRVWENLKKFANMGFGDYPAEYNPKIHGIYDPARFYGTRKCLNIMNFKRFLRFFGNISI